MKSEDFSRDRLLGLFEMGNRRVFWRHDVDFSPSCAIQMAYLEAECGVQSTYFLRVDCEEYDLGSMIDVAMAVSRLGHSVGTHVSLGLPRSARPTKPQMAAAVQDAFRMASELFPAISRRVSLHAPPPAALWRKIDGFEHAGAPCWKGYYLADSRGVWKQSPEAFLLLDAPVQLNLHPEWWFLPDKERTALREQEAVKP